MQINEFIKLFRIKIDEVLDSGSVMPSNGSEDFNLGDWTFLFNCVVYDLVREYNRTNKANLSICAEPEVNKTPTGRGGYSDILIGSQDKQTNFIVIEHENRPHKKDVLLSMVKKLSKIQAKNKLIITYYPEKKNEIIQILRGHTNNFFNKDEVLHLLISKWETECGSDYEYEQIKTTSNENEKVC